MPNGRASAVQAITMPVEQVSRLLPVALKKLNTETPLHILNLGPALPETVAFFSNFRCKLHIADLFPELPLLQSGGGKDEKPNLRIFFDEALFLTKGVQFDVVFFWDVLNFLNAEAVTQLMASLRPHLHANSLAHCFTVHNIETPAATEYYGINDHDHLSVRQRHRIPPGYCPHRQSELEALLKYFRADSSVLMRDQRLEILFKSSL